VRARLAQVQTARSVTALDTDKIKREVFELVGDVTRAARALMFELHCPAHHTG